MKFVQPIRDPRKIQEMKHELLKTNYRDYLLFVIGINTGLRISDILKLQVKDVYGVSHITIKKKRLERRRSSY